MIKLHFGKKIVRLYLEGNIFVNFIILQISRHLNYFRPSPKKDMRSTSRSKSAGPTSFQDFQASVSDAWAMDDDEFCIISGIESMSNECIFPED